MTADIVGLIDKILSRINNAPMTVSITSTHRMASLFAVVLGIYFGALSDTTVFAASTIYWCPDQKSDQQYSATPAPGCVPLVEKKDPPDAGEGRSSTDKQSRSFKVENLHRDVSEFLRKYRHFLECCRMDLTELRQIEEFGGEIEGLLSAAQTNLSNHSLASRGIMLHEMMSTVARVRQDLHSLRARLEQIGTSLNRRGDLDFEEAGREAHGLREIEESIERDMRVPTLPSSAKTGVDIGVAPAAGPDIGRSSKSGTGIGREGLSGQDIGASSKNSRDIGRSGPTGFEIGTTGRAGPSIGESSELNSEASSNVNSSLPRSSVGSSLSDSSVDSSLGTSSVGSSLQDSSIGSSFGGSSGGSSRASP